jgi:hypothetical protein
MAAQETAALIIYFPKRVFPIVPDHLAEGHDAINFFGRRLLWRHSARMVSFPENHATQEACRTMSEELKTAANWAKELGLPEKKLKDAMKSAKIEPDAKKGCCSYYSKAAVEKAKKSL